VPWEVHRRWLGLFWVDVGFLFRNEDAAFEYVRKRMMPVPDWVLS